MVHFPGLTRTRLWIQRAVPRVHRGGFPHSDIPGSKPACGSPRLFAACHVLRRLLAPRHPPYALSSLTIKLTQHVAPRCGSICIETQRRTRVREFALLWILPLALHSSRTCGFSEARTSTVHVPELPASFSCQRAAIRLTCCQIVSAPGGARSWFGASSAENKKPDAERRAFPSCADCHASGGRSCSKLDVFLSGVRNQPHLILEGEDCRLGQPRCIGRPADIREV